MTTKKILMVICQENFRDEEYQQPREIFIQKGFDVVVAAGEKKEAVGKFGLKVMPDTTIADAAKEKFDSIMVVGGGGCPQYLWGNQTLLGMVAAHHAAGKPLGAICLGPVVLARAGLLKGIEATMYKSPESVAEFAKHGVKTSEADVVTSGKIVTGNGPAAARKFALSLAALV